MFHACADNIFVCSEKELAPTSKVIDAFPRPPTYRAADRRSTDLKRRSVDSTLLLGSSEDVGPDDPVFILRRAVTYRPSSRHRLSAPLDEIALQKLHRESLSNSSVTSDLTMSPEEPKKQLSKQEIIAAQRAATRANQRAILKAEANSSRGLDVLLPGNAMIRSSRHALDDRMRYSYVEPDGETYDISEIVEAEWRGEAGPNRERNDAAQSDLLHGVLSRGKDGLGAKLERVLSQVRRPGGLTAQQADNVDSIRATSPSVYSTAENGPSSSRAATPNAQALNARSPTPTNGAQRAASPLSRLSSYRTASEGESDGRRTATPSSGSHSKTARPPHDRQQSLASVMSDSSMYDTASPPTFRTALPAKQPKRLMLPKDDFGLARMMAIIEYKDMPVKRADLPPLDPVDELLFGRKLDLDSLHPQIRDIYSSTFDQLEQMDNVSVFAAPFSVHLLHLLTLVCSLWMNFFSMLLTRFDLLVVLMGSSCRTCSNLLVNDCLFMHQTLAPRTARSSQPKPRASRFQFAENIVCSLHVDFRTSGVTGLRNYFRKVEAVLH